MQTLTSPGRKLYLTILLSLILAMTLSGCAAATSPAPPSTSTPAVSPTLTELPTLPSAASPTPGAQPTSEMPTPDPTPAAPPVPENLVATLEAGLPPTPTPDASGVASGGFDGVAVMPLTPLTGDQPLWGAFTHGTRSFQLPANHFVAVYTYGDTGWQELGRFELECPDSVHPDSVRQVSIEPGRIWLEVQGGMGTYSSCYDLLSFDGRALRAEVSTWSPIPSNLGQVTDVNGDGALEVVLDASDPYVLSRSHGVRYIRFQVLRWDGSEFVEVELSPLPASAQAELRELNNRAVELAGGGLWLDAQAAIDQALPLAPDEPTVIWNATLIGMHAESNREQVRTSPYPLLTNLFLGDYAAVLEVMRLYPPEEIFSPLSPVLMDVDAFTWEAELNYWVTLSASQALEARPDLAEAYFLRGWATYLVQPGSPEVLADIERAAALRPDEPLFSQSLAYLKKGATGG
jgi:hypothetical protein